MTSRLPIPIARSREPRSPSCNSYLGALLTVCGPRSAVVPLIVERCCSLRVDSTRLASENDDEQECSDRYMEYGNNSTRKQRPITRQNGRRPRGAYTMKSITAIGNPAPCGQLATFLSDRRRRPCGVVRGRRGGGRGRDRAVSVRRTPDGHWWRRSTRAEPRSPGPPLRGVSRKKAPLVRACSRRGCSGRAGDARSRSVADAAIRTRRRRRRRREFSANTRRASCHSTRHNHALSSVRHGFGVSSPRPLT